MLRKFGRRTAGWCAIGLAWAAFVAGGCTPEAWRTSDGTIVTGRIDNQYDKTTNTRYHLYVPRSYNPRKAYPLVITAQGTFPFDHAQAQRDKWVGTAEQYGLIICSADFDSANGLLNIPVDRPAPELVRDEKAALSIIAELKSRYNINPDGLMITGWSGGGFPAHFIGLRNPDLFRCIVGRAANFNEHLVTDHVAHRARHMHVYVFFGMADLPGFDEMNRNANFWYTVRGFRNFVIKQLPGGHSHNEDEAGRYLTNLVRYWPAVDIRASTTEGRAPLSVTLEADIQDPDSPAGRVDSILWTLGDGTSSVRPQVTHTYTKPGMYNVFLTVVDLDGHREYAQAWVRVW
jgi:poly(3-hydroxybutyrate) depolymerase